MKNFARLFSALLFLTYYFADAQLVVQKDTIAGTPATIMMDNNVSDLLSEIEDKCANTAVSNTYTPRAERGENNTPKASNPKITVPERELTQAEICRRNPRIMGYKIQLAVVKSNEAAREVGMYFRRRFPNMKVEIDASLRPNYKVMAGSYFTKQSAAGDLAKIRQYFKNALAIQYRVFCVEAK